MMTNPILFWVFALSGLCLVAYYVFVLLASREHPSSGERPASVSYTHLTLPTIA